MWPCDYGWMPPPARLTLANDEIHVWCFPLDGSAHQDASFWALLSAEEHNRATRFHFEKDRHRYVVAHGVLRQLLSRYTTYAPEQFEFDLGRNGKPSLPKAYGGDQLQFNISHSHNMGLCAIANHRDLGVDLEWMRPLPDLAQIAQNFFSPSEREQLFQLDESLQVTAFYHCWTRKEAYIKACGDGLSLPLDQFDVALLPGQPARFLALNGSEREAEGWFLRGLLPADNFVGAVAVPGINWTVKCWKWPEHLNG
jgi:4'-phosphopantetheinyl transferase